MSAAVRLPAVAGQFYPGKPEVLKREVENYIQSEGQKIAALGCLVPHAGYMYSGHVAGAVFGRLELPRRFVMMCPNHTGRGEPLAVMSTGEWLTPLGRAAIDEELAQALKRNCDLLAEDSMAHRREHGLEVQLPFLQKLQPGFSFVPITVGTGRYEWLEALGAAIAVTLAGLQERVLVVASSDMNHYESEEITRIKDKRALDCILALDPRALYEAITRQHITMCGFGPAIAMLTAAIRAGATHAEVIKYATSGDVSGERDQVVGYAGVAVG
jgi:hypothetical protein